MKRLLLVVTLVAAGGCVSQTRSLQLDSSRFLCCPVDEVAVSEYERGLPGFFPTTWTAQGCGRQRQCSIEGGGDNAYRALCLAPRG